jgi:hypothetical protein
VQFFDNNVDLEIHNISILLLAPLKKHGASETIKLSMYELSSTYLSHNVFDKILQVIPDSSLPIGMQTSLDQTHFSFEHSVSVK